MQTANVQEKERAGHACSRFLKRQALYSESLRAIFLIKGEQALVTEQPCFLRLPERIKNTPMKGDVVLGLHQPLQLTSLLRLTGIPVNQSRAKGKCRCKLCHALRLWKGDATCTGKGVSNDFIKLRCSLGRTLRNHCFPKAWWITGKVLKWIYRPFHYGFQKERERAKSDTRLRDGPNFLCMECDFSKLPKCLQMFTCSRSRFLDSRGRNRLSSTRLSGISYRFWPLTCPSLPFKVLTRFSGKRWA